MRIIALCVVVILAANCCEASLMDTLKDLGSQWKARLTGMGNDIVKIGHALKDVAVDQVTSLASQTGQALIGALMNSAKGVGKRDLTDVADYLRQLLNSTHEALEKVTDATFGRFMSAIERMVTGNALDADDIKNDLAATAAVHSVAVRGILSDTLNTGIDYIKKTWATLKEKATDALGKLVGDKIIPEPVMISRRNMLTDAYTSLTGHLQNLHDTIKPHVDKAHMIVTDLASALGHHAGEMVKKFSQDTSAKVGEIVSTLSDHLDNAKGTFQQLKEQLTQKIQDVLNGAQ